MAARKNQQFTAPSEAEEDAAIALIHLISLLQSDDGSPRGHVLAEIVETEKSYVDSLQIIAKKYMEPLKSSDLIDGALVDEIFSQIPTIMWHHERLLAELRHRIVDDTQCVGDVLLQAFRQNSLLECYSAFVNNWKNAKGSLKMAMASKPALARFLEANARQHKGKLNLDSLLIMPIQRIPRYELMVKELLKYTDVVHDDHPCLILLLDKIKRFALHIDCASVDPNDNREIEIEGWTAGLGHLIRQDMVLASINNANVRKEKALRCEIAIFLFADSLVLAAIKRKGNRKPVPNIGNLWEGCKFKLVTKAPLTEVHHVHDEPENLGPGPSTSSSSKGVVDELEDSRTIHRMMDMAASLKCPHSALDDILRDMYITLKAHQQEINGDPLELEIRNNDNSSNDLPELWKLFFSNAEKRISWLGCFHDTVTKYVRYGFGRLPQIQFIQALPIRKTRAGLQLSCAAPVSLHNKVSKSLEMSDVWVANSDGYVGQICILTLHPEPAITSCNGVCNSRITCIISVPPPPTQAQLDDHRHHHHHHHHHNFHSMGYESEDETHKLAAGHKTTEHWTVWLGTEDGGLHVYDCSDSVRVKKNRHKIQHSSPVICMVYYDNRVFASLANGEVAVYGRNQNGKGWAIGDPSWVTIGSAITPVSKMLCVAATVWCCCGSQVKVYSDTDGMLELLQTIQLTIEGNEMPKGVMALVSTDENVWIAVQGSPVIKCYNYMTFEPVIEINVGPEVTRMLAGCDDIIRQHKSACLRVTSLLIAPDKKLWIGTSAGVILTMSLSPIGERRIIPLSQGHTGQVRFLTCCTNRDSWTVISGGDGFEEFRAISPLPPVPNNNPNAASYLGSMVTSLMGESSNDTSGREDSTNHLLIWKIPKHN